MSSCTICTPYVPVVLPFFPFQNVPENPSSLLLIDRTLGKIQTIHHIHATHDLNKVRLYGSERLIIDVFSLLFQE